jgi:hypothetical protein
MTFWAAVSGVSDYLVDPDFPLTDYHFLLEPWLFDEGDILRSEMGFNQL